MLCVVMIIDIVHVLCYHVQICLREFDNNPETVVGRILEENLPPHIQTLDFSLPSSAMSSAPPPAPPTLSGQGVENSWPILDARESVYDNDEFDVFRRPDAVDLSRVHIGKKYVCMTQELLVVPCISIRHVYDHLW